MSLFLKGVYSRECGRAILIINTFFQKINIFANDSNQHRYFKRFFYNDIMLRLGSIF